MEAKCAERVLACVGVFLLAKRFGEPIGLVDFVANVLVAFGLFLPPDLISDDFGCEFGLAHGRQTITSARQGNRPGVVRKVSSGSPSACWLPPEIEWARVS
jgi:hypothetical protein